MELKPGEKIPLTYCNSDGSTAFYFQAIVKDHLGNHISGSPVNLSHREKGLYVDFSLVMPNVPFITAHYIVYDDSGYNTESTTRQKTLDLFTRKTDAVIGGDAVVETQRDNAVLDNDETNNVLENEMNEEDI